MIKGYLKQPYPRIKKKWLQIIAISSFISLFMILFQPFGLSFYQSDHKMLVVGGYGGVTFIILVFNLFIILPALKVWLVNWTVLKQFYWLVWTVFSISTGNYFYTSAIFPSLKGINAFLLFQVFTVAVGILPIVIVTLITQNIKLSQNLKIAGEINDLLIVKHEDSTDENKITLIADNEKDKIELRLSHLFYIESVGNYIQVCYLQDGRIGKKLLRCTIKRIESQIVSYKTLVKCHRAFIINMNHVESVSGNSNGLRIFLKDIEKEIPVSRNHSREIKNALFRLSPEM